MGNVPVEIRNIRYEMKSPTGAVVERGDVPQAYPRRIAVGASGVIGRTITADTAVRVEDVATIGITFDTSRASSVNNLLKVSNVVYRGDDSLGRPIVVADIENDSQSKYDDVRVAAILVDSSGTWFGFLTGALPSSTLRPGEKAQFAGKSDLPPGFGRRIASVKVIAFDN